ncbi:hypothetical protein SUGI_0763330 [Cryptomeria japonica]|nr:hypothetical protein SUGI_0763330 [Cryptomeria japonica]
MAHNSPGEGVRDQREEKSFKYALVDCPNIPGDATFITMDNAFADPDGHGRGHCGYQDKQGKIWRSHGR